MSLSTLKALSPLDGRYAARLSALRPIMSEYGYMQRRVQVEVAWFMALSDAGFAEFKPLTTGARAYLLGLAKNFSETDCAAIKEFEKTTNHDVKAVEYWIKSRFEARPELEKAAEFVHFACTSEDINNTSHALQLRAGRDQVVLPALDSIVVKLRDMAHLYASVPFNVEKDFVPISLVGTTPCALVINPGAPFSDLKGMVAYAKANPGKLSYATSGVGTSNHLAAELLQSVAGIRLTNVPYKGSSQIVPDLLSGTVMMSMESSLATTLQHINAGKLKAIAVTSPQRSRALPDVPTVAESGYPGFDVETWFGLIAPAGTPQAIVGKLQAAWQAGSNSQEAHTAFDNISGSLRVNTPQQFADFISAENLRWGELIRKLGIKAS